MEEFLFEIGDYVRIQSRSFMESDEAWAKYCLVHWIVATANQTATIVKRKMHRDYGPIYYLDLDDGKWFYCEDLLILEDKGVTVHEEELMAIICI